MSCLYFVMIKAGAMVMLVLQMRKMYLAARGHTVSKRNFQMQNPALPESLKSAVSQV